MSTDDDIRRLGAVSDSELDGFQDWLARTKKPPVSHKVASDYRSRLNRALHETVSAMRPNVQSDIRTAVKAFKQYRVWAARVDT